jgi:hypothetical protein
MLPSLILVTLITLIAILAVTPVVVLFAAIGLWRWVHRNSPGSRSDGAEARPSGDSSRLA